MSPLDESGAVFAFSPVNGTWTRQNPSTDSFPCARSYHTATASSAHLIVHAGCGDASTGRLKDTWLFDVTSRNWTQVADGPGDPRGGSAITWLDGKVWRFGGFNGKTELGGAIDHLDISEDIKASQWETVSFGEITGSARGEQGDMKPSTDGPGQRSVHALLPLQGKLVTIFGEGKPSPTGGHDAAGNFWGDIWAFDPLTGAWEEVKVSGDTPGERGWFAADQAGDKVVVWGGIDASNERLTDGWVLTG